MDVYLHCAVADQVPLMRGWLHAGYRPSHRAWLLLPARMLMLLRFRRRRGTARPARSDRSNTRFRAVAVTVVIKLRAKTYSLEAASSSRPLCTVLM